MLLLSVTIIGSFLGILSNLKGQNLQRLYYHAKYFKNLSKFSSYVLTCLLLFAKKPCFYHSVLCVVFISVKDQ